MSERLHAVGEDILRLPRRWKRAIMVTGDLCMIPLALWSALTLRLGSFGDASGAALWLYPIAALTAIPIFIRLGLYRAVLRFITARAMVAALVGITVSAALVAAVDRLGYGGQIPATAFVMYSLLAVLYVAGSRFAAQRFMNLIMNTNSREPVIIYGAAEAGIDLARALSRHNRFWPVAFVDDDASYQGAVVLGLEVFAPTRLDSVIAKYDAKRVLLTQPHALRTSRREIVTRLEQLGLRVQSMPDLSDVVAGRTRVDEVRDIASTDLLNRDCVAPNLRLLSKCIDGRSVLITGAGGSIGSELCRQIVRLNAARIVLFEMSEHALYRVDGELRREARRHNHSVEIVPLLGNAYHQQRIRDVMRTFAVQTVYHAAAYKHVPIVEGNVTEGIHNNIVATLHAAEAALETGVETFVLVSTDKAVNPTSVMGATKRVAELVLQGLHLRGSKTRFCIVRFGNVLDSSGSVVPLFRDQILRGGPVTVTDPDATRYFMTIPEAAQLVLQAGAMAAGGEVFVLDMGRPVRIDDLARRMIGLMGFTVKDESNLQGDIAIEYTGLRPGEKLYEEVLIGTDVSRTDHPMIRRALEYSMPWGQVRQLLDDLLDAVRDSDCRRAVHVLSGAGVGYTAAPVLSDWVAARKAASGLETIDVTDLASWGAQRDAVTDCQRPVRW